MITNNFDLDMPVGFFDFENTPILKDTVLYAKWNEIINIFFFGAQESIEDDDEGTWDPFDPAKVILEEMEQMNLNPVQQFIIQRNFSGWPQIAYPEQFEITIWDAANVENQTSLWPIVPDLILNRNGINYIVRRNHAAAAVNLRSGIIRTLRSNKI